jgi:hypothetical protein
MVNIGVMTGIFLMNSSAHTCHSTKPIQMKYALKNPPSIKEGVYDLFMFCFGMATMDLVKRNE